MACSFRVLGAVVTNGARCRGEEGWESGEDRAYSDGTQACSGLIVPPTDSPCVIMATSSSGTSQADQSMALISAWNSEDDRGGGGGLPVLGRDPRGLTMCTWKLATATAALSSGLSASMDGRRRREEEEEAAGLGATRRDGRSGRREVGDKAPAARRASGAEEGRREGHGGKDVRDQVVMVWHRQGDWSHTTLPIRPHRPHQRQTVPYNPSPYSTNPLTLSDGGHLLTVGIAAVPV